MTARPSCSTDSNKRSEQRQSALTGSPQFNWTEPRGADIGSSRDARVLIVLWDNDHFIRCRSNPINTSGTSYEVSSIYDSGSRHGLVVGSMTHDAWKAGVDYRGSDGKLNTLAVYGGASSKVTQDTMPHGSVSEPPLFRHACLWATTMTGAPGRKNLRRCTANPRGFREGATSAYGKFLGEATITALASGFGLLEPDASRSMPNR